jgi:hypothetical protein
MKSYPHICIDELDSRRVNVLGFGTYGAAEDDSKHKNAIEHDCPSREKFPA